MNKLIILFALGFIVFTGYSQTPVESKSKINDVFVYLKGAQVSRKANVALKKGENIVHFIEITNLLNEESIRIESDENVVIQAVILRTPDELSEEDEAAFLKFAEEKAKLQTQINRHRKTLEIYKNEENVILSNKNIAGQQKGVVIAELREAANFYRTRLKEIYDLKFDVNQKIAALRKDIYEVAKKEMELRDEINKRKSIIEVKLDSKVAANKSFTIRYFVSQAGWAPLYDIRVTDIDKPLTITGKAKVIQNTEEDWEKVNITLSTGNPANSIVKPDLITYWLDFNNKPKPISSYTAQAENDIKNARTNLVGNQLSGTVTDSEGLTLPGVTVIVTGTTVGTITDMDGNYQLTLPPGASSVTFSFIGFKSQTYPIHQLHNKPIVMQYDNTSLDEVVVVGYGKKSLKGRVAGLNLKKEKEKKKRNEPVKEYIPVEISRQIIDMEYKIDVPYTIPSDGESYMVKMVDYEVPAEYEYSCVPKYSKDAYLSANIIDWSDYNFLDGEANVYFGSKFVGKSAINTAITSDTMMLSIGVDKSITIERKNIKDFSERRFFAGNIKVAKGWEINIRNNKQTDINITVEDQYPVRKNSDIEIEYIESTGAKHNTDTGKLTWKLNIEPKESKKLNIKYKVKYPRNRTLYVE